MQKIFALEENSLSRNGEKRFVIVDRETGEILDDAQGYGYKTPQKAYAAFYYLNRDKSKDAEKLERKEHIRQWMREHKSFVRAMDQFAFEIAKGSWAPDEKFDANFVKEMLIKNQLEVDFTPAELLRVWKSR